MSFLPPRIAILQKIAVTKQQQLNINNVMYCLWKTKPCTDVELLCCTVQLSLNRPLYQTDTSEKWTSRLFTSFQDLISIFQTFSRSWKLLGKFQDFFKNNSILCMNLALFSLFQTLYKADTCVRQELGAWPGSWYVSGKLPSYPSPKLTLTLTSHLGQNVGLGEG